MTPVEKGIEPAQRVTDKIDHGIDEVETFHRDWTDDEERRAKRKSVSIYCFTTTLSMHSTVIDEVNTDYDGVPCPG